MATNRLLALLALLFVAACVFFLSYNLKGNWDFALLLRSKKLVMLIIIAYTIGISTLLFQTLTHNPILTPNILGFDHLYLLTQTALVFMFGGLGFTQLNPSYKFLFETFIMLGGAMLLFTTLLTKQSRDLARMILVGVIFGVLFRNLNGLLQRLIDPDQFAIAQSSSFANFNTVKVDLLWIGALLALATLAWVWQQRHKLDLLLLGKDAAIGLGLDYRRFSRQLLLCCALLVSVSTALVGPILFLGLLVCAIANAISPQVHHHIRMPITFFIAAITLILGQGIFEQVLKMQGVLSVVIEFIGGIAFIYLMLRKKS